MSYKYQKTDLHIYKAVLHDDWNSVSETFQDHPELRTKPINRRLETPLMIAVGTNRSHKFVKSLLSSLSTNDLISNALAAVNDEGDTALHYAAKIGNMIDAKILVQYSSNREIALHKNMNGRTPLLYAAWLGRKKEMLEFLYSWLGISTSRLFRGDLLTIAIDAGFLDIALKLVENSKGVLLDRWYLQRPLHVLASKPKLFPRGSTLGLWRGSIYALLYVDESKVVPEEKTTSKQHSDDDVEAVNITKDSFYNTNSKCTCASTTAWFKRIFHYLASPIKQIYDLKLTHKQTKQLVNRIISIVIEKGDQEIWTILGSTIATAVEFGNYEIIEECICAYPSIIWSSFEGFHLFHEAIKQRREQVYNLVYQMSSYKAFVLSHIDDETNENILHVAAKLAPSHRLKTITGAALQMQRELQWFKEVESFVEPRQKVACNKYNKTPRMVFTDQHKKLLKEGQEWMKDTASSSTVVAALVVTVAFAAVFTLPGGDKNEGKIAFMLFIISDAIALFSSATSVLLFLGILTSRYAEKDFLHVLPRRLMGGVFTLFLSLAATMIAFSATLALVLEDKVKWIEDKVKWIAVPLIIITCIPLGLFIRLQYPLLEELFYSTYGRSIFRKQHRRMIH